MQALAKKLRTTRLLGPLTTAQITTLLDESELKIAAVGDIVITQDEPLQCHLILIEGEMEAQRVWSEANGCSKSYTWVLKPDDGDTGFGFLGAANKIRARAISDVKYILLDAEKIDELIGWGDNFAEDLLTDHVLRHRMSLIKQVSVFYKVPMENIKEAIVRLQPKEVAVGDVIIKQGEQGEKYYVIESGLCDVIQADPFTEEVSCVGKMGPGDAFGEEALLLDGCRNATVVMTAPGTLLVLGKNDFDSLLRSSLVDEVSPDEAVALINDNKAQWLDCRYDMEHEESRITGAPLMSLGTLRKEVQMLDPDLTYIVYCRNGRRSRAAAYLLKERNIDAMSLQGGIKSWPYEIDVEPI